MWQKLLLSLIIILSTAITECKAQSDFCHNKAALDSTLKAIRHDHYFLMDDYQVALDSLLKVCPDLDYVWQQKAMPKIKTGDFEKAFGSLAHAVTINPQEWLPYQAFLKCIFSKDYDGALIDFEASEKLIKSGGIMDHSFDFFRGLSYLCLDSLPQAAHFLKKDFDEQEQHRGKGNVHHVVLFYWGVCQLKMKKYLDAELTFRECLRVYPQYPEPNFYLGATYALTGKKVLAKAYFVKAKQYFNEGYNSSEDQEMYVNYPFAIGNEDVADELEKLNL